MEDNNHIDELFRKGLNQNFPVDDNLWAQVESQLPSAKGRRGLWIFNLNSLAIMAILSLSMILKTDTAETKQLSDISTNNNNQLIVEESINDAESIQTNLIEEEKVTPIEIQSNDAIAATKINSKAIENIQEPSKEEMNISSSTIAKEVKQIKSNLSTQQTGKSISVNNKVSDLVTVKESSLLTKNLTSTDIVKLNYLESKDYVSLHSNLSSQPLDKKNFWSATRKPYYYYEIETSRSFGIDKKISGLDPEVEAYKTARESASTNNYFGLNLLSDYKFLQLGIGIRFSRYTERLSYAVDAAGIAYDISYDTTYTVVNGHFNSNGEPVILIHREIERIETERGIIVRQNLLFRNEFERLQIPIHVGVHKNYGRFYGNIRTSLLLNYSLQQTGAYVSNDLNRINNFEVSKQINEFVVGNAYSASLGYSINEFVVVGTRFNYETDLTSFTKGYTSKFSQYGMGLWLMWKPR